MKKFIGLTMASLMITSMIPTALAVDTVPYGTGTQVQYVGNGSVGYTITVPALLNPGQKGTVTLEGYWASDNIVTVTAEKEVVLTNNLNPNDKVDLIVDFTDGTAKDGISEYGSNTILQTFEKQIKVAEMPAEALFGTWSGKFNYNVSFNDVFGFSYGTWYKAADGQTIYDGMPTGFIVNKDNVLYSLVLSGEETVYGQLANIERDINGNITMNGYPFLTVTSDNAVRWDDVGVNYVLDTDAFAYKQYIFVTGKTNGTSVHPVDECVTWKDFIDGPNGYNASFLSSNNEIRCLDGTDIWNVVDAEGNKIMMSDIIIPGATYSLKLFN